MNHKHKCFSCECVWSHDASRLTDDNNNFAHKCPDCGESQFWKYFGTDKVRYASFYGKGSRDGASVKLKPCSLGQACSLPPHDLVTSLCGHVMVEK